MKRACAVIGAYNGSAAAAEKALAHLYPIDGAVHRVAKDATAWITRDAMFSMVIAGIDSDPTQADALKRWKTRESLPREIRT